jgi:hypothetical protein
LQARMYANSAKFCCKIMTMWAVLLGLCDIYVGVNQSSQLFRRNKCLTLGLNEKWKCIEFYSLGRYLWIIIQVNRDNFQRKNKTKCNFPHFPFNSDSFIVTYLWK